MDKFPGITNQKSLFLVVFQFPLYAVKKKIITYSLFLQIQYFRDQNILSINYIKLILFHFQI